MIWQQPPVRFLFRGLCKLLQPHPPSPPFPSLPPRRFRASAAALFPGSSWSLASRSLVALSRASFSSEDSLEEGGNNNDDDEYEDEEYTVFKLQVGLFGDISKWQKRLDNIGTKYDTDDEEGLHNIFRDALVLILRNTEYAGYVASAGKVFGDLGAAERKFNSVLMEERLKFKEETLVNVDGKKKSRKLDDEYKGGDKDGLDRWLCMTLLLCAEGKVKIPNISSVYDLKQVLTTLGGLSADDLVAVELLWTPQEDLDYYTKDELLSDYPSLLPLS